MSDDSLNISKKYGGEDDEVEISTEYLFKKSGGEDDEVVISTEGMRCLQPENLSKLYRELRKVYGKKFGRIVEELSLSVFSSSKS